MVLHSLRELAQPATPVYANLPYPNGRNSRPSGRSWKAAAVQTNSPFLIRKTALAGSAGHNRQLETGGQLVLDEFKAHPVPEIPPPPFSNYHKNNGLGNQ
jgi:hypothetical protein